MDFAAESQKFEIVIIIAINWNSIVINFLSRKQGKIEWDGFPHDSKYA